MKLKKYDTGRGTISYRPDTTDLNCIIEIHKRREYHHKRLGFTFDDLRGQRWLDLGANIGAFTALIEQAGGVTVAFEPDPINFKILSHNAKSSEVYNYCVTNVETPVIEFYAPSKESDKYRYSLVPTTRPYMQFQNFHVSGLMEEEFDGIKMDIEGSEFGLIDNLLIPPCKRLVMEYHFSKDRSMVNFHERIKKLKQLFSIVHYQPFLNKYDLDKPYPLAVDKMIYCVK